MTRTASVLIAGLLLTAGPAVAQTPPAAPAPAATPCAGPEFRQFGEASTDGGRTWATTFDFTYRPATAAP
ncbi:MAG: hypothetical protein Q7T19_02010 [Caulobacter sp.]|nr:hypothetical protein [Caulobacter sp.]